MFIFYRYGFYSFPNHLYLIWPKRKHCPLLHNHLNRISIGFPSILLNLHTVFFGQQTNRALFIIISSVEAEKILEFRIFVDMWEARKIINICHCSFRKQSVCICCLYTLTAVFAFVLELLK